MKFKILIILLVLLNTTAFAQTDNDLSVQPKLIKKQKGGKEDMTLVFKSNSGFVKLYKLTDSLFLLKAYDDRIYLNQRSIKEISASAKLLLTAEKDDKVALSTFRCEITKGKLLGSDIYWIQLFKQKSDVDLSDLSPAELYAITKSNDLKSITDTNGEKILDKVKMISYEEKIERFGITNKELQKLINL